MQQHNDKNLNNQYNEILNALDHQKGTHDQEKQLDGSLDGIPASVARGYQASLARGYQAICSQGISAICSQGISGHRSQGI